MTSRPVNHHALGMDYSQIARLVESLTHLNGKRPKSQARTAPAAKSTKEREVSVWVEKGYIELPRFEIPLDVRLLECMTPIQYLTRYCVVTSRVKKSLYHRHYIKHREAKVDGIDSLDRAKRAVKEVCTIVVNHRANGPTDSLLDYLFHTILAYELSDSVVIKFKTFMGICALAERLFNPNYMAQWHENDKKLHEDHKVYKTLLAREEQLKVKKEERTREMEIERQRIQLQREQMSRNKPVKNQLLTSLLGDTQDDDPEIEMVDTEQGPDNTKSELQLIDQASACREQLVKKASVTKILEIDRHPDRCLKQLMERVDFQCLKWRLNGIHLTHNMDRLLKIISNL